MDRRHDRDVDIMAAGGLDRRGAARLVPGATLFMSQKSAPGAIGRSRVSGDGAAPGRR